MASSLLDKLQTTAATSADLWLKTLQEESSSSVDVELMHRAFAFRQAEIAADNEQEKLSSSLEVAKILYELQVDNDTLIAGILHDPTVLDEERIENIKTEFGAVISALVSGVHRMDIMPVTDQSLKPGQSSQIDGENLRKMLLAMVEDVRVVLIKLADRLQQLRNIKNSPAEQQQWIAAQTQEIFAPLANRLGIWQLKWQLEDLSLRYLQPEAYHRIAKSLDERRIDRENYLDDFMSSLQSELKKAGIQAELAGSVMHINSMYRKMMRKNVDIDRIFDVRAVRILVDSIPQCYAALGIANSLWPYIKEEFDDYIK